MKKVCKTCGYEVEEGMNFCPNCGQKYPSDDSREIDQAMNEIFGTKQDESQHHYHEANPHGKSAIKVALGALVILLLVSVGALGYNVFFTNNEPGVQEPSGPGVGEENPDTPDDPSQNGETNPEVPVNGEEKPDEPKNPEQNNQPETNGEVEGLTIENVEFLKDNSDDIYRVNVYFEYTGEENLNVTLLDPTNTLQIGPIDLPSGADQVYFLLGKTTLLMVNQMDFIFATDANEITYTLYKTDYEKHLQE